MRPLSATECITPAIERTKLVLFSPFRMGRTWKLSATSYICIMGSMFLPFPLVYLAFVPLAYKAGGTTAAAATAIGVLVFSALFIWLFYLCSRLQFAWFDILVNRGEFVAPAWRKYGLQARPWSHLKLALGAAITLVTAVPMYAFVRRLIPFFRAIPLTPQPGQPPSPELIRALLNVYASYAVLMLFFGLVFLVFSLLGNLIVPSLALENTGIKEAFRRMTELIRGEPGEFALFVLLKAGLGIAGYMGSIMVWELVFLLTTLIAGAVILLLGFLLHLAGVPSIVLTVLGMVVGIAWYFFALIYTLMLAIGPVFTFLDAYAIYFLGGRYPMLGDLLERSTPPSPTPAAYFPAAYPSYPPPPPQAIP
ncbi:MAG: hypothetical protein ABSG84_16870 [Acidobacteriaceae bacterium]|jgi:hypothetical protein